MADASSIAARLNARLASLARPAPALEPALTIASHRSTTSSRKPGAAIIGTVRVQFARVIWCDRGCGHKRMEGTGPHAPHFRGDELVDCLGERLR